MTVPTFPPTKEAELLAWSNNFSALITAGPATYGLSAPQSAAYAALNATWSSAYTIATLPATNSKANVIAKNLAKDNLLNGPGGAWQLVNIIQAFPGTTDTMRGELGLRIPDVEMTPTPAPDVAPDLSIVSTIGRTVKIRLRDAENPDRRGKPDGVIGATVLTFVGEEKPADTLAWSFCLNATKTLFDVDFPGSVAVGAKVWVTAMWFNSRGEMSPAAAPAWTCLADGLGQAMAA